MIRHQCVWESAASLVRLLDSGTSPVCLWESGGTSPVCLLDSGTSPACVGECCITSLSVGECTSPVCLWESGTYTYVTSLSMGEWYVYVRHQSVYGRVVRICTSPVCRKVLHHQPVRGRVSKFNLMYFPPWGEPVRGSNQGSYLSAV